MRSKKYNEKLALIDKTKEYKLSEAVALIKKTSVNTFDASIEIAIRLNVDTRKSDEQVRGVVVLPNGTGKTKKVLVIADSKYEKEAKDAGADYFGGEDYIEKIVKEDFFDFDVIVASPEMMPKLGKAAKVLGPKGLMPNPKTGTVTTDIKRTVEDLKKGQVEYRADAGGIVHSSVGKVSFTDEALIENIKTYLDAVLKAKPAKVKGSYILSIYLSTSMGPSIKITY